MADDQDGCEWMNVSSRISPPGSPGQRAVKRLLLLLFCYDARLHIAELCRRKLDLEGCLTLLEVLEIYKVSRKLPGSVQPFVVNVPDSSCMSEVFNILCTKSPVENILQ